MIDETVNGRVSEVISYLNSEQFGRAWASNNPLKIGARPEIDIDEVDGQYRLRLGTALFDKDRRRPRFHIIEEGRLTRIRQYRVFTGFYLASTLIGLIFCFLPGVMVLVTWLGSNLAQDQRAARMMNLIRERFAAGPQCTNGDLETSEEGNG